MHNQAVAVLMFTPDGIPLVRDRTKRKPHYWKLPGGKGPLALSSRTMAIGKLRKELGVDIDERKLQLICSEDRGTHLFWFFMFRTDVRHALKRRGRDGEETGYFQPNEILRMQDFFPPHRSLIEGRIKKVA